MVQKKKKIRISVCLLILTCLFISIVPSIHARNRKVIRVGYPIQDGLTMKDKDGGYSGYTYDYLKEISQYTGWEYEFIEVDGTLNEQLSKLLKMLEDGEIDLLGAMSYTEASAEKFDFPSENYGSAYTVLAASDDKSSLDEYSLPNIKNLKVALLKKAKVNNESFYQYAKTSGLTYSIVWCENEEDMLDAVQMNKADVFLSVDLALTEGYHPVTKFSPTQMFFATTKGKTDVIQELNRAMSNINDNNPMLCSNLYDKYFNKTDYKIRLNQEEKNYVKQKKELKILTHDGFAPIQYNGSNDQITGIAVSFIEYIAKETGLKITYVEAKSHKEYIDILNSGEVDMLLSTTYDYDIANDLNITLSNPFIESNLVTVVHRGVDATNIADKKIAISKEAEVTPLKYEGNDNIRYYNTYEEKLEAIDKGECDYGYINSLALSYNLAKYEYRNIVSHPYLDNDVVRFSFGITKDSDVLTAILNKSIRVIKTSKLEEFIYQNTQVTTEFSLLRYIEKHILQTIFTITCIICIIIMLIYVYYHKQLKMKKLIEIENKRFYSLSEITNEIIFEYDYVKDRLSISDTSIEQYIASIRMSDEKNLKLNSLYEPLMKKKDTVMEVFMNLLSDEARWYRIIVKVIYDNDEPVIAIGKALNIHEEKIEKDLLKKQSTIDGLTNIYNAFTCKKKIQEILLNSSKTHALCILDVDYFKSINDQYGHYVGDRVLIHIADILRIVFYDSSIIGRLGGDEFIVFLKNIESRKHIEEKCRLLINHLSQEEITEEAPEITLSIGIALTTGLKEFDEVYKRADEALYHVKKTGRNNYHVYQ